MYEILAWNEDEEVATLAEIQINWNYIFRPQLQVPCDQKAS